MSYFRALLLFVTTLPFLTACVTTQTAQFEKSGRFAVSYWGQKGLSRETGRFVYKETPGLKQLDLLTPLNGILARIEVTPRETCLSRSNSESICRASTDQLLNEMIGFTIPVNVLGDVLKTGTVPAGIDNWQAAVRAKYPDGRIKTLTVTPTEQTNVQSLSIVVD